MSPKQYLCNVTTFWDCVVRRLARDSQTSIQLPNLAIWLQKGTATMHHICAPEALKGLRHVCKSTGRMFHDVCVCAIHCDPILDLKWFEYHSVSFTDYGWYHSLSLISGSSFVDHHSLSSTIRIYTVNPLIDLIFVSCIIHWFMNSTWYADMEFFPKKITEISIDIPSG